jgi:AraC family transcriptional regulator
MTHSETSRGVGWRSLSDASKPLEAESAAEHLKAPTTQKILRGDGLACRQAKRALDHIEAHFGSQIEIREIAKLVALSRSHFSRTFKRCVGFSPRAYVSVRRVEQAKLMMRCTSERLSDIAVVCGFADQPHLNRHFRRIVGMSPGLWRRVQLSGRLSEMQPVGAETAG